MMRGHWVSIALSCSIGCVVAGCGDDDSDAADAAGAVFDAPPAVQGWSQRADVGGGPIQETAVAELDGKIYVIGGCCASLPIPEPLH